MEDYTNTIYDVPETVDAAMEFARGDYQTALLCGDARWSGADLKGKARQYSGNYASSRENLITRLRESGLVVAEIRDRDRHGLKIMVIAQTAQGLADALAGRSFETK